MQNYNTLLKTYFEPCDELPLNRVRIDYIHLVFQDKRLCEKLTVYCETNFTLVDFQTNKEFTFRKKKLNGSTKTTAKIVKTSHPDYGEWVHYSIAGKGAHKFIEYIFTEFPQQPSFSYAKVERLDLKLSLVTDFNKHQVANGAIDMNVGLFVNNQNRVYCDLKRKTRANAMISADSSTVYVIDKSPNILRICVNPRSSYIELEITSSICAESVEFLKRREFDNFIIPYTQEFANRLLEIITSKITPNIMDCRRLLIQILFQYNPKFFTKRMLKRHAFLLTEYYYQKQKLSINKVLKKGHFPLFRPFSLENKENKSIYSLPIFLAIYALYTKKICFGSTLKDQKELIVHLTHKQTKDSLLLCQNDLFDLNFSVVELLKTLGWENTFVNRQKALTEIANLQQIPFRTTRLETEGQLYTVA